MMFDHWLQGSHLQAESYNNKYIEEKHRWECHTRKYKLSLIDNSTDKIREVGGADLPRGGHRNPQRQNVHWQVLYFKRTRIKVTRLGKKFEVGRSAGFQKLGIRGIQDTRQFAFG